MGIDIHSPSIGYAKKKNPFENVQFECTTVDKLADQQFDIIIYSEVLEHLEDPSWMLNETKRKLKNNGIYIITIPNGYGPKEMEVRLYNILYNSLIKFKVIGLLKYLERYKSQRELNRDKGKKLRAII